MTRARFLRQLDLPRVEAAIAEAERRSALEIRVAVAGLFWGDVNRVAERAFWRLGVAETRRRTGVLLFIAPWRRRIVLLADEAVRAAAAPPLLPDLVARMTAAVASARATDGIVDAILALSDAVASALPPDRDDRNELPDTIHR